MKTLTRCFLSILVLTFLSSGCASHLKKVPAPVEIGVVMLDLPAIPRPKYEQFFLDEPITSERNSEIFTNNITKLKDWAEKLFLKYEAVRAQNTKLNILRESKK